jgi:hypothetical protein
MRPIQYAAWESHKKAVLTLIDGGADIGFIDEVLNW